MPNYFLNDDITEKCPVCNSYNHIKITDEDADVWECWNCLCHWSLGLNGFSGIEEIVLYGEPDPHYLED